MTKYYDQELFDEFVKFHYIGYLMQEGDMTKKNLDNAYRKNLRDRVDIHKPRLAKIITELSKLGEGL